MAETLRQVMERGSEFLAVLDKVIGTMRSLHSIRTSRIDGVLVLPDEVLKRYYEAVYVFNTHFTPKGLPGVGMAIGDFLTHEGKTYLTISLGVCYGNMEALHLFRNFEEKFRAWEARRVEFDMRVKFFVAWLDAIDAKRLGLEPLVKADEWRKTHAGLQYVGTPNPKFCEALGTAAGILQRRKKKGTGRASRMASELEVELRPFISCVEDMRSIRAKTEHKGIPYIDGDIVALTSPAASGGASLHNKNAHDDLMRAVPNQDDFIMVAGQCGVGKIVHIGGGRVQGENFLMLLPRTPFFKTVQERLMIDPALIEAWSAVALEEDSVEATGDWSDKTHALKSEVVKQIVPELIAYQVLGFNMNLIDEPGTALLRPIMSESALAGNEGVIAAHKLRIIRKDVETVLAEMGEYYGKIASVFDEAKQ